LAAPPKQIQSVGLKKNHVTKRETPAGRQSLPAFSIFEGRIASTIRQRLSFGESEQWKT